MTVYLLRVVKSKSLPKAGDASRLWFEILTDCVRTAIAFFTGQWQTGSILELVAIGPARRAAVTCLLIYVGVLLRGMMMQTNAVGRAAGPGSRWVVNVPTAAALILLSAVCRGDSTESRKPSYVSAPCPNHLFNR
jgi:hypothetical protein